MDSRFTQNTSQDNYKQSTDKKTFNSDSEKKIASDSHEFNINVDKQNDMDLKMRDRQRLGTDDKDIPPKEEKDI